MKTIIFPLWLLDSRAASLAFQRRTVNETQASDTFRSDITSFYKFAKENSGGGRFSNFLPRQTGCLYEEVDELVEAVARYKEAPNRDTFAELLKEAADVAFCGINIELDYVPYLDDPKEESDTENATSQFNFDILLVCYPSEIEPTALEKKLFYPDKIKALYAKVLGLVAKDNLAKIQNAETVGGKVKGINHDKRAIYVEINKLIDETFNEIAEHSLT